MPNSHAPARGLSLAPLPVRLVLAITFIWAGYGKVFNHMPVQGEDAAILANLGLIAPNAPAPIAPGDAPAAPLPTPRSHAPSASPLTLAQANPAPGASSGAPARVYTADDFPEPVQARSLWGVALSLHKAGHPAPVDAGAIRPLWPRVLSEGIIVTALAVAVTIAEFAGGILVLIGWFTRTAAFGIACVMLGALWLTQFGPAWQSHNTFLGFLPNYTDPHEWSALLWLVALFGMACSLVLGGSGRLAIDWALRSSSRSSPAPRPPAQPAGGAAQ